MKRIEGNKGDTLFNQIRSLVRFRSLFVELIRAEISLRYRKSVLGVAWTVMNPIINALVLFFLFRAIFKIKDLGDIDFFPYVYSGVLLLNFITRGIVEASEQLHVYSPVIRRISVPSEIFVISKVLGNLLNFFLGLVPLLFYLGIINRELSLKILLVPIFILPVFLIVSAISLLLSILYLNFRDIEHLMPIALNILFYISPVFYSVELIGGNTRRLVELNPLTTVLESCRYIFGVSQSFNSGYLALLMIFGTTAFLVSLRIIERNRMKVVLVS